MSTEQLEQLGELVRDSYAEVRRRCPDLPAMGGCLLLGKHYVRSPILYLGINPSVSESDALDIAPQSHDWLVDEHAPNPGHVYWTNSRKFFASTPQLRAAVAIATFAFCCPYRTASWSDLSKTNRDLLTRISRPITRQIANDCQPTVIIVAGKAGFDTLEQMLAPGWARTDRPAKVHRGTHHQWASYRGTLNGQGITIAQVPHFSYARSPGPMAECAEWLSGLVTSLRPAGR